MGLKDDLKTWHSQADNAWRKGESLKAIEEKKVYYEASYLPACEVVLSVANQNSRGLGIHPVKDAMALITSNGIVSDKGAWFYTMEFPKLENDSDPFGVRFKEKMNIQLGNFVKYYGIQLPCNYLELARNLKVVMIRNTGSSFIAYMGLVNDSTTQAYMNNRYNGR